MNLNYRNLPVSRIDARLKDRMRALLEEHFDNVQEQRFLDDLAGKEGVLLLENDEGLQGFSTWKVLREEFPEGPRAAIYSGDTIIRPACWGQPALFRGFSGLIRMQMARCRDPLYWLLLSKGIRTYLMLPLFFREYCPDVASAASAGLKSCRDAFARLQYGEQFHPAESLVRPVPQADRLKAELAAIPVKTRDNPHVRFFLSRNPRYAEGEELVCMARLHPDNFTRSALRIFR